MENEVCRECLKCYWEHRELVHWACYWLMKDEGVRDLRVPAGPTEFPEKKKVIRERDRKR